jgi:dihydrofolate synthase/folylpolyglutamate synthase
LRAAGAPAAPEAVRERGARVLTVRSFEDACRFLFPRTTGGIKWGLETTEALLASLGNPERHFAAIHVGGTNGKGSVSTLLAEIMRSAGWRVGLYTSPHLVSFRERVAVDGVPISEDAVTLWAAALEETAVRLGATFFEVATALAFADFAARGVDLAVVEVGLGGRLDATNVLSPLACGVTRIAVEHTEYLGADRRSIAREKAGIAKRGVPFVTTEADPEIAGVLMAEAQGREAVAERLDPAACLSSVSVSSRGITFDAVTPERRYAGLEIGLAGAYQAENALLALRLAELVSPAFPVDEASLRSGLLAARVPGRFDRRGKWIYDVAHNPDGVRALVGALRGAVPPPPRPVVGLVSVLRDKAWREMLELLAAGVDELVLTRAPSAPADRAWDLAAVSEWARERGLRFVAETDFAAALERAARQGATVLVTGSFHTVGDAMSRLPGAPPLG